MRLLLRVLAIGWALPNTAFGAFLAVLSFQRPRVVSGVLAFDRVPRGSIWILHRLGWRAITFGHVVLSARRLEGALLAHELVHVRQYERLGPLFVPAYVALHLFAGYRQNPFETQALRGEAVRRAGPA